MKKILLALQRFWRWLPPDAFGRGGELYIGEWASAADAVDRGSRSRGCRPWRDEQAAAAEGRGTDIVCH